MAVRRWVAIQRNRRSGAGRQFSVIMELIRELRSQGITPRLFARREDLDAAVHSAFIRSRTAESGPGHSTDEPTSSLGHLCGIVAAGGDGTVLDLLNRHPDIPVAVLPMGTENLLARHLGIPRRDGTFVARMIARGETSSFDLGVVNGRRFAILASCGFDADVIHHLHRGRTGNIGHRHYFRPIVKSLWNYRFPELKVTINDADTSVKGGMVVVANLPDYAFHFPLVPTAVGTDGLLDVRVFPHRSRIGIVWDLLRILCRWHERTPDVHRFRATRIRIESTEPVPVEADGDAVDQTPITIEIIPCAATLFVPSR